MADRVRISPRHGHMLTMLLRSHLSNTEVWPNGSRANDRADEGSDLDLALRGPGLEKIPSGRLMDLEDLEDAIRESTIRFPVEARNWARVPERFRR